jgi:hypothetical protein
MLQNVHHEMAAPRASSLYCRWICIADKERARLVAVWIDSEMRCFAKEFAQDSEAETLQQEALDDPGWRQELFIEAAAQQQNRRHN